MNRRVVLLLVLILIIGGAAVVVLLLQGGGGPGPAVPTPDQTQIALGIFTPVVPIGGPTPTPLTFVNIVIALQELPRGIVIPEDGVRVVQWPLTRAPNYALSDPKDAIGKIARTDIAREMPILSTQLVENLTQLAKKGSDAAAVLPTGLVAIAIPIDRIANVAHAPKSGDYVDVIMSFLFVDVDEEFQSIKPNTVTLTTITEEGKVEFKEGIQGRIEPSGDFPFPVVIGPAERQRPRLVTQRTVQSALVLNVGTFPEDGDFLKIRPTPTAMPTLEGGPTPTAGSQAASTPVRVFDPDIITLGVEPQDAVVLAWAVDSGTPLMLALRSAQDLSRGSTTAVTLEYMITTYQFPQPPRLPYALEPRIASIRKMIRDENIKMTSLDVTAQGGQTRVSGQP